MDGSGSGDESSGGGGPMPGDVDENCPGTLDPARVYVAFAADHSASGLALMPVDDPEEICVAAWNLGRKYERKPPFIFRVRPTDGGLLAGYVTEDGAEFAALGLDWISGDVAAGNDTVLASFEDGREPFFAWAFDDDAIYYSVDNSSPTGEPRITVLFDAEGNAIEPGFTGSFVTITEDGARWGIVPDPPGGATDIRLSRTLPTGEVSTFEAPLDSDGTPPRWWPEGARVVGNGGWLVVSHVLLEGSDYRTALERWTFGPQGLVIEDAWSAEVSEFSDVDRSQFPPNALVLDAEGAMVTLVTEDPTFPEWIAVRRAPLDGEFQTVLSLDDAVHGGDGEFEVEEILGLVTGQ